MGTRLNNMQQDDGSDYLYTDAYLTYMASHMRFLREHSSTIKVELDQGLVHKNMNDFYGLFMDMEIRYEDHQLLMMVNGYNDPLELTEEVETLLIPDGALVDSLKQLYRTSLI